MTGRHGLQPSRSKRPRFGEAHIIICVIGPALLRAVNVFVTHLLKLLHPYIEFLRTTGSPSYHDRLMNVRQGKMPPCSVLAEAACRVGKRLIKTPMLCESKIRTPLSHAFSSS